MGKRLGRGWSWGVGACLLSGCSAPDDFGTHFRGEPTLLSSGHADEPTTLEVVMNDAGEALVLWTDFRSMGTSRLRAARYTPAVGWEPPELLASGRDLRSPSVALDENGNALATWAQQPAAAAPYSVVASRFVVGTGWSAPADLEQDSAVNATNVALSITPRGQALAVWSDASMVRGRFFDPDAGWGVTETLSSTDNGSQPTAPAGVGLCSDGSAVALWGGRGLLPSLVLADGTPTSLLYVNRYDPATGWGGAESTREAIQSIPQLRCGPEGRAKAVWTAPSGPISTFFAGEDASGAWTSGILQWGSSRAQLELVVGGEALVVLNDPHENRPVEAFFGTTPEGPIESKTDGLVVALDLASNAAGQAQAIWARNAGHGDDLWLSPRDPEAGWGEAEPLALGVPSCRDECFIHSSPRIGMDAAGNSIVAWIRHHDLHGDVVAQVLAP